LGKISTSMSAATINMTDGCPMPLVYNILNWQVANMNLKQHVNLT
jgi:hypothetical protein